MVCWPAFGPGPGAPGRNSTTLPASTAHAPINHRSLGNPRAGLEYSAILSTGTEKSSYCRHCGNLLYSWFLAGRCNRGAHL